MYLNLLDENEKKGFLLLAHHAMEIDGVITDEERMIVNNFIFECHLLDYDVNRSDNLEEAISSFEKSNMRVKKVVLLELLGVLLADRHYHETEKEFIKSLSEKFSVKDFEVSRMARWVEAMNDLVQEGYSLLGK